MPAGRVTAGRWLLRALGLVAAFVLGLQLWFLGWVLWWRSHAPQSTSFMQFDQARAEAQHRPHRQLRTWVPYDRISPSVKRAVIASEDANFLHHHGVDVDALLVAWRDNERHGRPLHGGSTLTQQLAKNLFLSPRRSYLRKGQELVIAFMLEATWSKQRILEVYLNSVEWGDGIFGIEAASRHYFGIPAASLDADQGARLAAMLPSPRVFDRNRDSAYLSQRASAILAYAPGTAIP
jgi:monofunctional biosynthetic peptidoglycan transglycosylase